MSSDWPSIPSAYEWKGTFKQSSGQGGDRDTATAMSWSVLAYCKAKKQDVIIDIKKYQGTRSSLNNETEASLQSIADFAQRLHLLSGIKHPNLMVPFHSFLHKDEVWMIYQRSSGGTLHDLLSSHYPNGIHDEKLVATLLYHVVHGVEYLHKNQLTHRCIRPRSIFFDQDLGITLLSEFDELKKIKFSHKNHQSDTLIAANREPWTDPLILMKHPNVTWYHGDIFSIGITALNLVFGAPPIYSEALMRKLMLMAATLDSDGSILYEQIGPEMYGQEPPIKSVAFEKFIGECTKGINQRITASKLLQHSFFNPKHLYSAEVMKDKIGHLFESTEMKVRSTYSAPVTFPNVEYSITFTKERSSLDDVMEEEKQTDHQVTPPEETDDSDWNFKTTPSGSQMKDAVSPNASLELQDVVTPEHGPHHMSKVNEVDELSTLEEADTKRVRNHIPRPNARLPSSKAKSHDMENDTNESKADRRVEIVDTKHESEEDTKTKGAATTTNKAQKHKSGRFEVEPGSREMSMVGPPSRELSTVDPKAPLEWDVCETSEWVSTLGNAYKQYLKVFVDNGIDGEMLHQLDDDLLKEIIPSKLHRAKIISAASHLF